MTKRTDLTAASTPNSLLRLTLITPLCLMLAGCAGVIPVGAVVPVGTGGKIFPKSNRVDLYDEKGVLLQTESVHSDTNKGKRQITIRAKPEFAAAASNAQWYDANRVQDRFYHPGNNYAIVMDRGDPTLLGFVTPPNEDLNRHTSMSLKKGFRVETNKPYQLEVEGPKGYSFQKMFRIVTEANGRFGVQYASTDPKAPLPTGRNRTSPAVPKPDLPAGLATDQGVAVNDKGQTLDPDMIKKLKADEQKKADELKKEGDKKTGESKQL